MAEKKCPKCKNGYLGILDEDDMKKLKRLSVKDNLPETVEGCDECKYWREFEG